METKTFSLQKAEAFAGHMLSIINGGHISISLSLGNRTGLFETMAKLPPSTSREIANAAGLEERYVHELLCTLVVGRIVDYNKENKTYSLSAEHAAFLTKAAGPDNLSVLARNIGLAGRIEDKVLDCFYNGGGVEYGHYFDWMQSINEFKTAYYDKFLLNSIIPLVPGLKQKLQDGIAVLDVGCGNGHATNLLAGAFPKSYFTGYDLLEDEITSARNESVGSGLANVSFIVKDAASVAEKEKYDLITAFDTIHDQAYPRKVLKAIHDALRERGILLIQDIKASSNLEENISHPLSPTLYTTSLMHCMTVSLAYGGEGLGTMWGKQKALELLKEAGFKSTLLKEMEGDHLSYYYISLK